LRAVATMNASMSSSCRARRCTAVGEDRENRRGPKLYGARGPLPPFRSHSLRSGIPRPRTLVAPILGRTRCGRGYPDRGPSSRLRCWRMPGPDDDLQTTDALDAPAERASRLADVAALRAEGIDPYPVRFDRD